MKKLLAAMAIIAITGSIASHLTIQYLQEREQSFLSGLDMAIAVLAPIDFPECNRDTAHMSERIRSYILDRFTRAELIAMDKESDRLFDENGVMINEYTWKADLKRIVFKYDKR